MIKRSISVFLLISILMVCACNQSSNSAEEKNNDTSTTTVVKNDSTPYGTTIDRFAMGGESVQKIADTLGIKMFIVTMKPGDSAALHSHPDYAVYVLQGGEMAVTAQGSSRRIVKLESGKGLVIGPSTHTEKNTGKTTIKLLLTHIYRPRIK